MELHSIDPREEDADFKMMSAPDMWPLGRVLALKHETELGDDGQLRLGLLVNHPDVEITTVWCLNLYDPRLGYVLDADTQNEVPRETYTSMREVVNNGWRVN